MGNQEPTTDHSANTLDETLDKEVYVPLNAPMMEKEEKRALELSDDFAHAEELAYAFRNEWRFAHHSGKWMIWNGQFWEETPEETIAWKAADELQDIYLNKLASLGRGNSDEYKRISTLHKQIMVYNRVKGALSFLKGMPGFSTLKKEWDADPWLLNVENGILDLRTTILRPHDPSMLQTRMVNTPFEPAAFGPFWEQHITMCLPDEDVRRQVQRDLGIALVGEVHQERLTIWYGTGANGKTTTQNVIERLLGGYVQSAAPDLLIAKDRENHPTEMADLFNVRLLFAPEVGTSTARLNEPKVKKLTGGDRIKARYMRQDFFEFKPSHDLIMTTNNKPIIEGTDLGIWRRVCLIPWDVSIPVDEQRPQAEVVGEILEDAPAVLMWLLEGLRDWMKEPKWISERVRADTEEYKDTQDRVNVFIREACKVAPRGKAHNSSLRSTKAEIYEHYTAWCAENEEQPLDKQQIGKRLISMGFRDKRVKNSGKIATVWLGLQPDPDFWAKNGEPDVQKVNVGEPHSSVTCMRTENTNIRGLHDTDVHLSDTGIGENGLEKVKNRLEECFLPYERENRLEFRLFFNPNKDIFKEITGRVFLDLEMGRNWIRRASERGDLQPFYYDAIDDAIRRA